MTTVSSGNPSVTSGLSSTADAASSTLTATHETIAVSPDDTTSELQQSLSTTDAGQQMLDEAQQAGSALKVDLSGMSVEQMVLAVFGAANQSREELATTNMNSLNTTSQNVGTLTSLMNSVRSLIPTSTDTSTTAELPQDVADQLKALGVSVPDGSASSDGQGTNLTEDQFNSLVQNCQSTIDTLNSTTTTQLQDLTKVNDDMSEDMQAMSKTVDDTHQMDMGILQN